MTGQPTYPSVETLRLWKCKSPGMLLHFGVIVIHFFIAFLVSELLTFFVFYRLKVNQTYHTSVLGIIELLSLYLVRLNTPRPLTYGLLAVFLLNSFLAR